MSKFLTDFQSRVLEAVRAEPSRTTDTYRTAVKSTHTATQRALDVLVKDGHATTNAHLYAEGTPAKARTIVYYPVNP